MVLPVLLGFQLVLVIGRLDHSLYQRYPMLGSLPNLSSLSGSVVKMKKVTLMWARFWMRVWQTQMT
jgi:hypothetical protein